MMRQKEMPEAIYMNQVRAKTTRGITNVVLSVLVEAIVRAGFGGVISAPLLPLLNLELKPIHKWLRVLLRAKESKSRARSR
ncbi:MAG: hypothetical protein DDT33_01430 [Firmicutes bacterium]|nr:hypothetical protein [Bacillota bacterium]